MRIAVVAGILRDRAGRVLLAERQKDIKFTGLWEFPGGKREPSETPEEALGRELSEELGIELTKVEKFLSLDHDYADRLVHIDFFLVTEWRGEPRPMDGQGLRWVLPAEISKEEMLPANIAVVDALAGE